MKPTDLLRNNDKFGIRIEAKNIDGNAVNKGAPNKAGLKIQIQGTFMPRMAVFGVPSDISADGLKAGIKEMVLESDEHILVKAKFGPRAKNHHHWVIIKRRKTFLS